MSAGGFRAVVADPSIEMQSRTGAQARRTALTRAQIVHAALRLFAASGIDATSMDDIRLAAGCSKGGLYHHFKSKQALIAELISRLAASGALLPPFADAGADAPPAGAGGARILVELWAAAARDAGLRQELSRALVVRWSADGGPDHAVRLTDLVAIGALVESVAREGGTDAGAAARRLGVGRAA